MALRLVLLEGLLLFAAVSSAIFLWAQPVWLDAVDVAGFLAQALGLAACCVAAFYYNDLYDLRIVHRFRDFAARLLQAFGVAFILLAGFYALAPGLRPAEGAFVSSLVMVVGVLLPVRALTYAVMRSRPFQERVLVLGSGRLAERIVAEIEAQPAARHVVVGVVEEAGGTAPGLRRHPLVGPLDRLAKLVADLRPERIIVAVAEARGRLPVQDLLEARVRGVAVEEGAEAYERLTGKLAIETLRPSQLVFAHDFEKSPFNVALGRAVSFAVSLVGLALGWPLLLALAAVIRLDSPGPACFVHDRIGLNGRPFRLVKFRTMRAADGPTSEWVRDNDARITRVGRWLRKFRLDELPQLLNILRGDMNLVGPRPHPVTNLELFREAIPYYALRAMVRPGVTGWAQIRYGYANDLDEEIEKMRYDLYYIKHLSPWLDLRILFDTVKIVLFGRGSQVPDAYPIEPVGARGR